MDFPPKRIVYPGNTPGISGNRSQKSELPNLIKFTTERYFNVWPFSRLKNATASGPLFQAARATAYSHKSEMEELGFNKHDFVNLWYFAMTLFFLELSGNLHKIKLVEQRLLGGDWMKSGLPRLHSSHECHVFGMYLATNQTTDVKIDDLMHPKVVLGSWSLVWWSFPKNHERILGM